MKWRNDPNLEGRFHPEHPDDLQVIVHEGGPRLNNFRPELMWVKVTGQEGSIFSGTVLNEPAGLKSICKGDNILFTTSPGAEHPFRVRDLYLSERTNWDITPCNQCGFSEMFDAPSALQKAIFPNLPSGSIMQGFTSFCPLCGGVQVVSHVNAGTGVSGDIDTAMSPVPAPARKWWQFWR